MNFRWLWVLMVLGLPAAAAAEGVADSDVPIPESRPEINFAAPAEPSLDLNLDPGHLPSVQDIRPVSPNVSRASLPDAGPVADKVLSFGLDVRTRPRVGDEIREDFGNSQSLAEDVKGAIERSTFGVTGTYRF